MTGVMVAPVEGAPKVGGRRFRVDPAHCVNGAVVTVGRNQVHGCTACHGTGRSYGEPRRPKCSACKGSGWLYGARPNRHWPVPVEEV